MAKYGNPPVNLGLIHLFPHEMMFWLYCPIKKPGPLDMIVPANLTQYNMLLERVFQDVGIARWRESYVYLTAKTLWVNPENPGNRPGWHSDGFMTDDLNYVWSDRDGTVFWEPTWRADFTQDHVASLAEMQQAASVGPTRTYPDKTLLRLDETVIHRIADFPDGRYRTFVKVSISTQKYNILGNSYNHMLPLGVGYFVRGKERNHTSKD